jgi:serine/threonine-protein phosphatase 6 regulatory subunit 3
MSQLYSLIVCLFVQVLIRLIGADETMYSSYADSMQWLDDIKVLEMIVDKFSTSVRTKDCF